MFLATLNIFWPIARSCSLVVKKTTNAELFSSCSVPTSPVPCAGSFMAKDTIEPITMFCSYWRVSLTFPITVISPPGVVTTLCHTPVFSSEHQSIWTVKELWTSIHTFPVTIAILDITHYSRFRLTGIFLLLFLTLES